MSLLFTPLSSNMKGARNVDQHLKSRRKRTQPENILPNYVVQVKVPETKRNSVSVGQSQWPYLNHLSAVTNYTLIRESTFFLRRRRRTPAKQQISGWIRDNGIPNLCDGGIFAHIIQHLDQRWKYRMWVAESVLHRAAGSFSEGCVVVAEQRPRRTDSVW